MVQFANFGLIFLISQEAKLSNRGDQTRELILDLAEAAILEKGFTATTIHELQIGAGVSKGGFFYHFSDKADLAKHLFLRYLEREDLLFSQLFEEAERKYSDPLDSYLEMVSLLAKALGDMQKQHPGCLVAVYAYQNQLFNREIRELNKIGVGNWRATFSSKLTKIAEVYPPKKKVDIQALADALITIVEGAIVISRAMQDPAILTNQVLLYRDHISLVFRK